MTPRRRRSRGRWFVTCHANHPMRGTAEARPDSIIMLHDPEYGTAPQPPLFPTASPPDPHRAVREIAPAQPRMECPSGNRALEQTA
jgi:hypothetical protein